LEVYCSGLSSFALGFFSFLSALPSTTLDFFALGEAASSKLLFLEPIPQRNEDGRSAYPKTESCTRSSCLPHSPCPLSFLLLPSLTHSKPLKMGTFTLSRSFMRVANLSIQISRFASVLTLYFLVLFNYASFVLLQNRVGSKFGGGGVAGASETNVDRRERLRKIAMGVVDLNKVRPRTCHSSPKPHSLHHPNLKIEKKKKRLSSFVCI
jgi:hypothetical protein